MNVSIVDGIVITLISMLFVFLILLLIMFVIQLLAKVINQSGIAKSEENVIADQVENGENASETLLPNPEYERVAVLTALALASEAESDKYFIVSEVKRLA